MADVKRAGSRSKVAMVAKVLAVVVSVTPAGLALVPSMAVAASPASETAYAEGQTLLNAKKLAEAADKFEAAVAADPGYASAWYSLAVARRRMSQCPGAIAAYRRYAALEPDKSEPYYGLGLCLRETGDRPGAIEALRRYVAIEKQPASQRWVENARSILTELGATAAAAPPPPVATDAKPAAAKPAANPAAAANAAAAKPAAPATPTGSPFAEAQALRERGHFDEAIAKYQQAIAADPKHIASRAALGELLLKIHREDEAIEVFRAALDKNPSYPLALYDLAFALRVRDRPAEAVDAYQRYIKLRPSDPDAYYGLGRAFQHLGRKADAKKAYQTYVSMEKRPGERRWVESAQTQLRTLVAAP
jgi:tetratricopeptide (TPR) repeat protein